MKNVCPCTTYLNGCSICVRSYRQHRLIFSFTEVHECLCVGLRAAKLSLAHLQAVKEQRRSKARGEEKERWDGVEGGRVGGREGRAMVGMEHVCVCVLYVCVCARVCIYKHVYALSLGTQIYMDVQCAACVCT